MSDDTTDILGLPLIQPGQAQKHVTHNEALLALDAIVQLAVLDRNRAAPPETALPGDRHLVFGAGSGLWAGQGGTIAVLTGTGWQFHAPRPGWSAYLLDEGKTAVFDGTAWAIPEEAGASLAQLGINTAADEVNRLAVASDAVLLTHAGAGVQLKLNKAAPTDTASLLFQTGWSGRAEMGTAGSDGFAVKVSADGTAWTTGFEISAASGAVNFPQNLTRAGSQVFARNTILGTVGLSAGVPTGAVIERGAGVHGEYIRFADGTQLCWSTTLSVADVATGLGAGFTSAALSWSFPQPFLSGTVPVVSGLAEGAECWLSQSAPTAGAASLRVLSLVAKAGAVSLSALAVGRWI